MARKSLDAWIHEQLTIGDDHDGKCTRIVLCHLVGTGRTEVHTAKFADTGKYDPKAIANVFLGKADAYCQDMPGDNRFVLDAYWKTSDAEAFQPFTRTGQVENRHGMRHPPTEEGAQMQKMEWVGNITKQVFDRQNRQDAREDKLAERMESERQSFFQDRQHLMAENMKFFDLLKELYIKQVGLTHEQKMAELDRARSMQREKQLTDIIPMVTNMVTGREIFPQSNVDSKILESIAKKLTPEVIGMLGMLGLSEEEQGILMHRFNQIKEKQAREEAHGLQLPQTSLSGEDELTGKGETH